MKYLRLSVELFFRAITYIVSTHPFSSTQLKHSLMIRLALFADIHGKFLLPFKLAHRYQQTTGKSIDLIVQCGDMGAFPDKSRMDKATLRHAARDRDELGFIDDFVHAKPPIAQFLDRLNLNMLCVRGNHEDHEFLDELERQSVHAAFPIDAYRRVWVLKTGEPFVLQKDGESLEILGIGRIGDRKQRPHGEFIQEYERQTLRRFIKDCLKNKHDPDVLITHDQPADSQSGYGAEEIANVLDQLAFAYHFYGHTGEAYRQNLADNGITLSVKIKELEFDRQGKLSEGCMLILEVEQKKGDKQFTLSPVPLNEIIHFMQDTWRYC